MADSFWTGGPDAYAEGLKQHYEALLQELHRRLGDCQDESLCHEIELEIANTKAVYKEKLRELDKLIFGVH